MSIPVIINGASGKMGRITCETIEATTNFSLVAKTGHNDNLSQVIADSGAKIVVDFSTASVGFDIAKIIMDAGAHPVIGTSGFTEQHVKKLQAIAREKKLGGIIAPNFCIAAVLMMELGKMAAKHLPHVEIIEMHHDEKADAPSGTAVKTAEVLSAVKAKTTAKVKETEIIKGARGGALNDIHIHSVRLPGLVAHQQILFGNTGETLSIRHDMLDRKAAMAGVLLACEKVQSLDSLVYGLEHIL